MKGDWKCVQVHEMVLCQGKLPFSIDVKGGEKVVERGALIVGEVLVLPSMPKWEIADLRLALMSTQAAPGMSLNVHGTLGIVIHDFLFHNLYRNIILKNIFLPVYSSPRNSS